MGRPRPAKGLLALERECVASLRRLTPQEKLERLLEFHDLARELQEAGRRLRDESGAASGQSERKAASSGQSSRKGTDASGQSSRRRR